MSKRPRPPRQRKQPAKLHSAAALQPANPRLRLVAEIAAAMAIEAARTGVGDPDPDAELLCHCAVVNQVQPRPGMIDPDEWQRALFPVSSQRALTLAGLRANVEIAVRVARIKPEPGDEYDNLERMVLWLTLTEVLAIIDETQA